MTGFDWRAFLQQWSRDLYQRLDDEQFAQLPAEVKDSIWFGFPGASSEEIAAAEERLGTRLPPSYRDFLQVSNGWRQLTDFITNVLPVSAVEWLAATNPDVVAAWATSDTPVPDASYFVYGEDQDPAAIRAEYLRATLNIARGDGTAFLLLNPEVRTSSEEWEAWFFADWLPGATRYRSFQDLIQALHQQFVEELPVVRELPSA